MAIQEHNHAEVVVSSDIEKHNFSIAMDPSMFELLSSGVYSDPITAVLRELGTNCYDVHVAAGKADVPFKVSLPSAYDLHLTIRDFGFGLGQEDMFKLYTTYGASTKRDTNEQVGMLGIGSKSPFALSQTFTVTSFFNGEKRVYAVYVDETGLPSISLMGNVEASDEPSGLEIKIPVKNSDLGAFLLKAAKIYRYFPTVPLFENVTEDFEVEQVTYLMEQSDLWKFHKASNTYDNDFYVIQGTVAYPVEFQHFKDLPDHLYDILNLPLDVRVPIGSCSIAASREALKYNDGTQKYLIDMLEKIHKDLPAHFQSLFDGIETLWEAKKIFNDRILEAGYTTQFEKVLKGTLTWQGKLLEDKYVRAKTPRDSRGFTDISGKDFERAKIPFNYTDVIRLEPWNAPTIIWNDGTVKAIRRRLEWNFQGGPILMINTPNEDAFKNILTQLGNPPEVIILSELDDEPKENRDTSRTRVAKLKRLIGFRTGSTARTRYTTYSEWTNAEAQLSEGGLYVPICSNRTQYNGANSDAKLQTLMDLCEDLGFTNNQTLIYGVPASHRKVTEKFTGWVNFFTFVREKLEAIIKENDIDKLHINREVLKGIDGDLRALADQMTEEDFERSRTSKLAKFKRGYEKLKALTSTEINRSALGQAALKLDISIVSKVKVPSVKMDTLEAEALHRYPLIEKYSHYDEVERWKQYINLIDKTKYVPKKEETDAE
jgi:hypothetical protein